MHGKRRNRDRPQHDRRLRSVSKHLSILENAGLGRGEKRGQFIHYSLVRDNLVNTLNGYVRGVPVVEALPCPRRA